MIFNGLVLDLRRRACIAYGQAGAMDSHTCLTNHYRPPGNTAIHYMCTKPAMPKTISPIGLLPVGQKCCQSIPANVVATNETVPVIVYNSAATNRTVRHAAVSQLLKVWRWAPLLTAYWKHVQRSRQWLSTVCHRAETPRQSCSAKASSETMCEILIVRIPLPTAHTARHRNPCTDAIPVVAVRTSRGLKPWRNASWFETNRARHDYQHLSQNAYGL